MTILSNKNLAMISLVDIKTDIVVSLFGSRFTKRKDSLYFAYLDYMNTLIKLKIAVNGRSGNDTRRSYGKGN